MSVLAAGVEEDYFGKNFNGKPAGRLASRMGRGRQ